MTLMAEKNNVAWDFEAELSVTRFYSTYTQPPNTDGNWVRTDLAVSVVFCERDQGELMDL